MKRASMKAVAFLLSLVLPCAFLACGLYAEICPKETKNVTAGMPFFTESPYQTDVGDDTMNPAQDESAGEEEIYEDDRDDLVTENEPAPELDERTVNLYSAAEKVIEDEIKPYFPDIPVYYYFEPYEEMFIFCWYMNRSYEEYRAIMLTQEGVAEILGSMLAAAHQTVAGAFIEFTRLPERNQNCLMAIYAYAYSSDGHLIVAAVCSNSGIETYDIVNAYVHG